jgi:molecular chaperone DnaK (HSP70)
MGGAVSKVIARNSPVPTQVTDGYTTYADDQTGVDLRLMENQIINDGETVELEDCTEIGSARLPFKRPLPKDSPIEVTFALGPDGRLHMQALDTTTGEEIEAKFETESIMSREEVAEAKQQALKTLVS